MTTEVRREIGRGEKGGERERETGRLKVGREAGRGYKGREKETGRLKVRRETGRERERDKK